MTAHRAQIAVRRDTEHRGLFVLGALVVSIATVVAIVSTLHSDGRTGEMARSGSNEHGSSTLADADSSGASVSVVSQGPTLPLPPVLTAEALDALPEVRYDSVIGGLLGESVVEPAALDTAYSVTGRTALFGADRITPVASVPAVDFLGEPTVVVGVEFEGDWVRVLTPARQVLPSHIDGDAPAQTAAWMPASALTDARPLTHRIVVSATAGTLTILAGESVVATFPVGVGADQTPTPTGVTGYLQARYVDPAQNQSVHRVQLTSLHATAADEPYGGSDGGLIGLHYSEIASGPVSHGCIRLDAAGIAAVDSLPLGTPLTVEP